MTILAWYTLIVTSLVVLLYFTNSINQKEKEDRIFSFVFGILTIPIVIFAIKYLF